jgi:hypothetical protein
MTTETDTIEQKLTSRQLKAIPFIVTSPTYTEGCEKARVDRTTFYEWLRQPEFRAELERQREQVASQAFGLLSQNLTKAVEKLVELLDDNDKRLRRFAAKDIIEQYLKCKELQDLTKRIEAIEGRIAGLGLK